MWKALRGWQTLVHHKNLCAEVISHFRPHPGMLHSSQAAEPQHWKLIKINKSTNCPTDTEYFCMTGQWDPGKPRDVSRKLRLEGQIRPADTRGGRRTKPFAGTVTQKEGILQFWNSFRNSSGFCQDRLGRTVNNNTYFFLYMWHPHQ